MSKEFSLNVWSTAEDHLMMNVRLEVFFHVESQIARGEYFHWF